MHIYNPSFVKKVSFISKCQEFIILPLFLIFIVGIHEYSAYCKPLTLDELGSWGISLGSLSEVLNKTLYTQGQGPIYFLILSKWIYYFGDSKDTLRFLSLIFNYLNVITVYFIGSELFGRKNAKYLCILYLFTPMFYSDEILARPYCLSNLILSIILLTTLKFLNNGKKCLLIILFILTSLLILTHYLYILGLASLSILLFTSCFRAKNNRYHIIWLSTVSLSCIASLIPIFNVVLHKIGNVSELAHTPSPSLYLLVLVISMTTVSSFAFSLILTKIAAIRDSPIHNYRKIFYMAIIATLVPYITLFILAHLTSGPFFIYRYFSITSIFSAIASLSLILSYPRLKYALLITGLSLINIQKNMVFGSRPCQAENTWVNSLSSIVAKSNQSCKLYASPGFIELQSPENLSKPDLQEFLKAPISYYYRKSLSLLPLSISTTASKEYFYDKILPDLRKENCIIFILYKRDFETDTSKLLSLAKEIDTVLDIIQFDIVSEYMDINSAYRIISTKPKENLSPR